MKSIRERLSLWVFWGLLSPALAHSLAPTPAPASVRSLSARPFNEQTWSKLIQSGSRPAAYLFTTTHCSACPAVFEEIRDAAAKAKGQKSKPELVVIMMDADARSALKHASHFHGMGQFYIFEGHEPAIRATIDPSWRNITPYVVLVDRDGQLQRGLGSPGKESLLNWLK